MSTKPYLDQIQKLLHKLNILNLFQNTKILQSFITSPTHYFSINCDCHLNVIPESAYVHEDLTVCQKSKHTIPVQDIRKFECDYDDSNTHIKD